MPTKSSRMKFRFRTGQGVLAVFCVLSLSPGNTAVYAQQAQQQGGAQEQDAPKIPNDQLDALVAPIALYPDPLLSQVLVASTYPLEIIQLQQWLAQHKDLKGDALVAAVEKEDWDPSIQGLAALPDAVKQLAENIKWTTDLGNAFLAQQSDVMDAVQRMRAKAQGAGNLKSNEQMTVETKVVESKTVVVIEQASPQVIYVPSYNPVVVYGPPVYPYPPIVYPVATAAISFGIGVAMGAAWGGGWGYHSHWGGNNNITINNNNNFVNHNNNINGGNRNNINGGNRPIAAIATGSTIPRTAVALLIRTKQPLLNMEVHLAGMHARTKAKGPVGNRRALRIAAAQAGNNRFASDRAANTGNRGGAGR